MRYNNGTEEVEAVRWDGANYREMQSFCDWRLSNAKNGVVAVPTIKGWEYCREGDYVIKYGNLLHLCRREDFERQYTPTAFWN